MPLIRPTTALRATRSVLNTPKTNVTATTTRDFSSSIKSQSSDHGHESPYDPPTGWLWGIKPGEKYEKEGWENVMIFGFCGGLGLAVIAYAFKPDTSIQTWALEEARRRLEAEGILEEPKSK